MIVRKDKYFERISPKINFRVNTHFKTCESCGSVYRTPKKYSRKCDICCHQSKTRSNMMPRKAPYSLFKRFKI